MACGSRCGFEGRLCTERCGSVGEVCCGGMKAKAGSAAEASGRRDVCARWLAEDRDAAISRARQT